jgi:alanyl aminopeptidase
MRYLLAACFAARLIGAAEPSFYLPDGVRPLSYRLDLRIDPSQPGFTGTVSIRIEVAERSDTVWLNGTNLTIVRADVDSKPAQADAIRNQFLRIQTGELLAPGPHELTIEYSAKFSGPPIGAYRRKSGTDWYVYTTFTAIEARRAFPCFDEPRFKTPWELTISTPKGLMAVANSRAMSDSGAAGGWHQVRFAATKPLPSEVVAFAVGPFDVTEGGLAGRNHVPVRVIAPKGRAAEGRIAAASTAEILSRLEQYTGIPYPWDKLDHIALIQGAFGAVENPGLITYRENRFLVDPAHATERQRLGIRSVMAHELAHQWFGNLVTQRTWDDVWLSEGFATWLGGKTWDQDLPPERRGVARVIGKHQMMARDRGPRMRPVRKRMRSVEDMRDIYSPVVYQKGAAVLAMLEQWLGGEAFERALHRYLTAHAFANATTADLAAAIREETGTDVGPVLAGFLDHTGVPQIRISLGDGAKPGIVAYNPTEGPWIVPVCVLTSERRMCGLVASNQEPHTLADFDPEWAFADAGGAGYYWVDRPSKGTVPLSKLTPAERMDIVLDILSFADLP